VVFVASQHGGERSTAVVVMVVGDEEGGQRGCGDGVGGFDRGVGEFADEFEGVGAEGVGEEED
jgi:hypothetical protein